MDAGTQTLRIENFWICIKICFKTSQLKFGAWETWKPKVNGNKAQVFC